MDILRLRCFLALSEYLSFTYAAEALHISQSSMSKHINRLEQDLGVQLFERRGKITQMTEEAAILINHAKSIVEEYDDMMKTVTGVIDARTKITRLGIPPMGSQNRILNRLKAITESQQKISLKIVERQEVELISDLMHGNIDMCVIRKEILPDAGFRTYTIIRESAVVMLPKSHRLSEAKYLDFNALKDEKFIFFDELTAPHKIFLKAIRNAGFEPTIVRTVKTETVYINCVLELEGICLLFESDSELIHFIPGIELIPLKEDVYSEIVLAVQNKKKATPVEKLIAAGLRI